MDGVTKTNDGFAANSFSPKEDTYAVISPEQKKLGRVKDVDDTGITFDYIDEGHNAMPVEESLNSRSRVDIFIKQQGYFLRGLPIARLVDSVVRDTLSFSRLPLRQIKIEFGELNVSQKNKLEYLSDLFSHHPE